MQIPPGLGDALQAGGDIDAVAHQIAVALLDDVAEMNADAEFDALVGRDLGVALGHRPLDFNSKIHCVDDAAEFDNCAVSSALDDAPVMHGDCGIDQVAPKGAEPSENSILVRARKPRVANNVGYQDRCKLTSLAHRAPSGPLQRTTAAHPKRAEIRLGC
jgi:hypothetical protein